MWSPANMKREDTLALQAENELQKKPLPYYRKISERNE
jgi:hypothetical protein